MKTKSIIFLTVIMFFFINCGENKAATNKERSAENAATEKKSEQAIASSASGNDLVGTWKLRLEVFDDNSNRIPDEAEMKKGYPNNYMFQFNADGTCRIQQM